MQPLELKTAYIQDKIPQELVFGRTPYDEIVRIQKEQLTDKHWYILGETGSGKSRTNTSLLQQILANGLSRVIFVDPVGAVYLLMLSWYGYLTREYYMRGESQWKWFSEKIIPNVLFIDLSDKNHQWRHNMLAPLPGEDISDVIARNIKFFDSLFSDQSGESGLELQLQRRVNIVNMIVIFIATGTPMEQARHFIYNQEFRERLLVQAEQRSSLTEVREAVAHFRFLEETFRGGKFGDKIISLETGLSQFFESPVIRKFLLTSQNNIDFQDILNTKTCFIKAPANDLPTKRILFKYIYNMFFDLAPKRPEKRDTVYLGSDESSIVMDHVYADMITRIRNYGILLITSHQARKQMLTPEGMRIAEIVESQSGLKLHFRNDYEEAEKTVDEIFTLTGKMPKLIEVTTTITRSTGEGSTHGVSQTSSEGRNVGIGQSAQEGFTETSSKSYSVSDTYGITEGVQRQWSEAVGQNLTKSWQVQDAFTYSQNIGKTLTQLTGQGITFTVGEGRSMLRIETESGVVTIGESKGTTETRSESQGYTDSIGDSTSDSYTYGKGNSLTYSRANNGQAITVIEGAPVSASGPVASGHVSETINNFKSASSTHGRQKSQAWQTLTGVANSSSEMLSRSKAEGRTTGQTSGITKQEASSLSKQFSESVALAKSYARAIQRSLGHGESYGRSNTFTSSIGDSVARSVQRALQQGEGLALATTRNWGVNLNKSLNQGFSQGEQHSYTINIGMSLSISWKLVYYSMEEERRYYAQMLRSLPPRSFLLSLGDGNNPVQVISGDCFKLPSVYGEYDFLKILSDYYKHLPAGKGFCLLFKSFPKESVQEVRVYNSLPDDFSGFLPL